MAKAQNRKKPFNLLYIFADQLGASMMGCDGHPDVKTPHLDAFGQRSVRFKQAYTTSPLCTPYRGCLMTGQYPLQTGVLKNWDTLPDGATTLAGTFANMGYRTTYIGKWHLSGTVSGCAPVPKDKRAGYEDFIGWESGHPNHWDQILYDNDNPEAITMQGHETDALTDIVCDRLEGVQKQSEPFFMTVSYQAPHPVCDAPEPYKSMYKAEELTFPKTVDFEARFKGYGHYKTDMAAAEWTERHYGEITHLDAAIARVFEKLDSLGLSDDTIVVFSSDHGDMAGTHGMFEKQVFYEMACRVPLLVHIPGLTEAGAVRDEVVSTVDLFPTLVDMVGGDVPKICEGQSLLPLMENREGFDAGLDLLMETAAGYCLRRGDKKLVLSRSDLTPESLFDIRVDPDEVNNLVEDPEQDVFIQSVFEDFQTRKSDLEARGHLMLA